MEMLGKWKENYRDESFHVSRQPVTSFYDYFIIYVLSNKKKQSMGSTMQQSPLLAAPPWDLLVGQEGVP